MAGKFVRMFDREREMKMMKSMMVFAGNVFADYTVDVHGMVTVHKVYRKNGTVFTDPAMFKIAASNIRGQIQGWMRVTN